MNRRPCDRLARWALGILAAGWFLAVHRYGVNVLDEGYLLGPVQRILDGQVPYRDFVHQYAPGRFYIVAAIFSAFPPAVETTRILWSLLLAGSVVGLYSIARRVSGPVMALWAPLCLMAAPGPWQKSPLVACTVVSLWALGCFVRQPGVRTSLLVGLVTGVVCLIRQDVGVYAIFTFVVLSAVGQGSTKRQVLQGLRHGLSGLALVLLPPFVLFGLAGALGPAVDQVLFAGLDGLRANSLPFPSLFPWLPRDLADLVEIPGRWLHYVPPVVYVASLPAVVHGIRSGDLAARQALAVLVMGGLLFRLDMDRSHILHLVQVLPPAWILVSWHGSRWRAGRPLGAGGIVGVGVIATSLLLLQVKLDHFHYPNSVLVVSGDHELTKLERAHLHVAPRRKQALEGVVAALRGDTAPGEAVLALPDLPLLHFLADRPNPIRFELLRPGRIRDSEEEDALLAAIDEAEVRRMVWNARPVDGEHLDRRLQNHAPIFWGGVRARFEAFEDHGPYRIFHRRDVHRRPDIVIVVTDSLRPDREPPEGDDESPEFIRFVQAVTPSLDAARARAALLTGRVPGGGSVSTGGLRTWLNAAGYQWRTIEGRNEGIRPAELARQVWATDGAPLAVMVDLAGGAEAARSFVESVPRERDCFIIVAGLAGSTGTPPPPVPRVPTTRGSVPGLRTIASVENRVDGVMIPRDPALRVGLWLRLPGGEAGGLVHGAPVSLLDVTSTVVDWLGISPRVPLDGVSLVPLARGMKPIRVHRYIESGAGGWWGLRSPGEKWLYGPEGESVLIDLDGDPAETMDFGPRSRVRMATLERWGRARLPR